MPINEIENEEGDGDQLWKAEFNTPTKLESFASPPLQHRCKFRNKRIEQHGTGFRIHRREATGHGCRWYGTILIFRGWGLQCLPLNVETLEKMAKLVVDIVTEKSAMQLIDFKGLADEDIYVIAEKYCTGEASPVLSLMSASSLISAALIVF